MKLEFLADGSPDCPLIRLYGFDRAGAVQLREIFKCLAAGARQSVPIHQESGMEPIEGCRLDLRLGKSDVGIVQSAHLRFECILTAEAWSDMAFLVDPFCESEEMPGYQWLNESGKTSLLLSRDGKW
jgi:hypothetical protein